MYPGGDCPLIAHQERCGRPNCRHVTFKVEWVNPVEEQACTNSRTVPNGQLTGSSWQPPHHEVKVPTSRRTVSSLRELWIGVRSQQPRLRDRKLRVAPPQGPHPKLPHLRAGVKTPACERRSLLTGISHGEPSRREIRSENRTRPGQNGATRSRLTSSRRTLARTPGSRAIGEPHTDEASATSVPRHPVPVEPDELESTRGDIALSTYLSSEEVHLSLAITLSRSASPPRGEASIPRASAPALFIDRMSAP